MNERTPKTGKKVLFVVTKGNFGGAQRYVYDLATNIPDPYEPVVAAGTMDGQVLFEKLKGSGIRTIELPTLTRDIGLVAEWRTLMSLYALIKTERPDVVHLNSPKAGGLGALAARLAGVPRIIYTAHGWPFWEPRPMYQRTLIYFFSWLTVMLSHKTICISSADKKATQLLPFAPFKTVVIYNGIRKETPLPRTEARNALYSATDQTAHENDVWVVSVAEFTKNKNLLFALEAIAAYNQTHDRPIFYTLMGTGELEVPLKETAARLLPNHVHFAGFVDNPPRYLQAYDTLFLPSLKEGVPYAVLEAQCAGVPVVASHVGGIPEVATPQDTLINAARVSSAVQGLERSLCTPPTEDRCIHTIEKMVAETLQVY